ncbi:hypothetical protein K435DRAFT_112089 [Dendrothele bispora CBS 962.96]|uniref:Uncharacterized protein n=1 Tax=Dendrothele bispora (strain CBS 962.96) TaxID=1314807 RepID=A0A4S8M1D6_DENBC|nr:hypothetical protein K435DRAFT_112089 [Dendrothele bispora CBS 962.96]
MMLLLWIIGHRLSEDQVGKLVSTAVGDALKREQLQNPELEFQELTQLDSVNHVLVSLRKMIKTKLPLPPDRNPFQGRDYNPEDENKPLPRSELWGYQLPEEQQYEYDIWRNPMLLLQPLQNRVIIPQTKLTVLIIQWAACNFGLGKKVYSLQDVDPESFWNADPPDDDDCLSASTISSNDSFAFEVFDGTATPPYEDLWYDEPIEDWIHARFCSVYRMHGWAHRSLVRVLLFNAFSRSQSLPTYSLILDAVHVADRLSHLMTRDVLHYVEQFIIAHALLLWRETNKVETWNPRSLFSEWSPEKRSLIVIFVDALRWDQEQSLSETEHPRAFEDIREFVVNPMHFCQDASDIISLPLIEAENMFESINQLPKLDPSACVCGECFLIESKLPSNLEHFRHQYFSITSSRPNDCDALARTWEPTLQAAEKWLEDLITQVECQFTLLPWSEEDRTGPAVLEVANMMNISVGSVLSDRQLLRLVVALSILRIDLPPAIPKSPGRFGLGFVVTLPWQADREDYCLEDYPTDNVIFANGGWLYDLVSMEGVSLLHAREELKIVYHTTLPGKFSAICMPNFRSDHPVVLPPHHLSAGDHEQTSLADNPTTPQSDTEIITTIVLSNFQSDAFPLVSVCSRGFSSPRGALAALLRVELLGRVIETIWKPDVKAGSPCEHRDLWGRMTHCSPSAMDLILRVLPPKGSVADSTLSEELLFAASADAYSKGQDILRERTMELAERVAPLLEAGSPLERNRACIVRCGARDGPVDALIILAASLKKSVYVLDHRECWDCALSRMQEQERTVGIAIDIKNTTFCDVCRV